MWHVNKCEQVGRVVGFSKKWVPPECQSILKVRGWIPAAGRRSVKSASEEGECPVKPTERCMACPGAARKQPRRRKALGGEEGNPPVEVAWSQSSRAMTGRGGGVLPVGSQELLWMLF